MKPLRHRRQVVGFTLIELLVVIGIIAILAAMLLPALSQGKQRAYRAACLSNLKQVGIAFQGFANDHHGKFPMQVSTNDAGLMEMIPIWECCTNAYYPLASLSNELINPKVLICPADFDHRTPTNFTDVLLRTKSSYIAWYRSENDGLATTIIASDGNIVPDFCSLYEKGVLTSDTKNLIRWTEHLHRSIGNMAFADGHVEALKNGPNLIATVSRSILASAPPPSKRVPPSTSSPSRPIATSAARTDSSRSAQSNSAAENNLPKSAPGDPPGHASYAPFYVQATSPSVTERSLTTTNRVVNFKTNEVPAQPPEVAAVAVDDSAMGATDVVVVQVIQSTFRWLYLLLLLVIMGYFAYKYCKWQRQRQLARQQAQVR